MGAIILSTAIALTGSLASAGAHGQWRGNISARLTPTPRLISLPTRFNGQVTGLNGSQDNPTGFTLQVRARFIDLRYGPSVNCSSGLNCVPRSAEAEVEGFQVGDYALVTARRVNRTWVATHIDFDTQPIDMLSKVWTGTVVRVNVYAKRFILRLDTGGTRTITVVPSCAFRVDGQLTGTPPPLKAGDMVKVTVRPTARGWIATEIDLKTTGSSFF